MKQRRRRSEHFDKVVESAEPAGRRARSVARKSAREARKGAKRGRREGQHVAAQTKDAVDKISL